MLGIQHDRGIATLPHIIVAADVFPEECIFRMARNGVVRLEGSILRKPIGSGQIASTGL